MADPGTGDDTPQMWAAPATPPERADLGRLALRRWRHTDTDALDPVIAASQDHLRGFMPWAAAHSRANTEDYLQRCEEQGAGRTAFQYALTAGMNGPVVGSAGLMGRVGPEAEEVGYWVAHDRVGQGLATLAAAWLTDAGLGIAGVGRIEIHHDLANVASARIPAKLGYRLLEEREVPAEAETETGRQGVWEMPAADWPGSVGHRLLTRAAARDD